MKKTEHLIVHTEVLAKSFLNEVEARGLDYQIDREGDKYRIQVDHTTLSKNGEEQTFPTLGQALAGGFLLLFRMGKK